MACPKSNVSELRHLEALAIAKGIDLANNLTLSRYNIELDCLDLVNRINNEGDDLSNICHIVLSNKQDIRSPCCLGITYTIRRFNNVPTHILAKATCEMVNFVVWIEERPECILPTILADMNR